MKTIYECSQSKIVKWITAISFLIITVAILANVYYASKGNDITPIIVVTVILLLAAFSCFLVFPMYIVVDDEGIGIRTLLKTKRINYADINYIKRVDEHEFLYGFNAIRLFGIGGILGFIGCFYSKGIGTFLSYVTDTKKVFLIYRTKGMPIAISVNEPDEFLPYYLKGGEK